ncbi:hypothetical protein FBQ95_17090 [Chloroflexi bacterium CFX3]|nr:hypothetical protein [Chloroflexi bacterium CFX3]
MPALGSPSTWRTRPHSAEYYVTIVKPPIVFQALVNGASFTYPLAEVPFDTVTTGAYTDITAGQLVCFGSSAGKSDLGRQRIRKAATSTVLYIGWSSQGVRDGEVNLSDNIHITVYNLRMVWARTPRITEDGTIYKDFDLPFTEGTLPPPVANIGTGYAEFVNPSTSLITVNFVDGGSFATAQGATIKSRAWVFPGGTPASSTATNPGNVTFPAGFRYASLTVTDSNDKTHTAYAPIFGATPSGATRPVQCQITDHTRRAEGQRMSIRLLEDLPEDDYPDGALVMVWAAERYGSSAGSLAGPTGRQHMVFVGWIDEEQHGVREARQGLTKNGTLELIDVGGRLDKLPGFPQEVARASIYTRWTELLSASAPAHIGRFVHYILHWHSTALTLADFVWGGTDYPFTILSSGGQSLYAQANQRCEAIGHRLTCNAWGKLQIKPDPQLQAVADRTSTVIVSLTEADWLSAEYAHTRPPRAHWQYGAALLTSTTPYTENFQPIPVFARAPGKAPGQGLSAPNNNYQLVRTPSELYTREGNRYAVRTNAAQGTFRIDLAHGGEAGIDPAEMEWIRFTVSSANRFRRGLTFTNERFLPVEVQFRYDHQAGLRRASVVAERESSGTPAVDDPPPAQIETPGGWEIPIFNPIDWNLPPIDFGAPIDYTPPVDMSINPKPNAPQEKGMLFLATSDGFVVRVSFDGSGDPVFEDISASGDQLDAIGDSAIKLVQDAKDPRKLWLFGQAGILVCPNAKANTPTWSLIEGVNEPATRTRIATFDAGGSAFDSVYGSLFGGGNPNNCWGDEFTYVSGSAFNVAQAEIYINMPSGSTALGMSFDFKRGSPSSGTGLSIDCYVQDVNGNIILGPGPAGMIGSRATTINVWNSESVTFTTPKANAVRAKFRIQQIRQFESLRIYIDNCSVTYQTPNDLRFDGIADFVSLPQRGAYCWLGKRTLGATEYVYFYRTVDNFQRVSTLLVARHDTQMTYSITYNPHKPSTLYISAGKPSEGDAFIYKSTNGGVSFEAVGSALTARGGALWWNWSTETPNQANNAEANLRHIQGLSGSNLILRQGLTGSSINLVTNPDLYPETANAYYHLKRDLSFGRYAARTGVLRTSSNAGATWASAAGAIPGGTDFVVRGIAQFPSDSKFSLAYGYRVLAFTTDTGSTWSNLWGDYDTWRAANFSTLGQTLVSALPDLSVRYPLGFVRLP